MPLIAITSTDLKEAKPYVASVELRGGQTRVLTPDSYRTVDEALDGVSGLLLSGGEDIHPRYYGQEIDPKANVEPLVERDEMEMAIFRAALERNMPILGICRGMQLINVAFGGTLIQDLPGHRDANDDSHPISHQVYVSPGSKLGAIVGLGAVFKTNSWHHQGCKEAQRAPGLMASAYHPVDGIIEGLESPQHKLLIGVQCHIERENEVSNVFLKLFEWLVAWSTAYEAGEME
jgi:gamma-glutamyl-gamma-aminobutyrate hydrolase PuuD